MVTDKARWRLLAPPIVISLLALGGCETAGRLAVSAISPLRWNGQSRIELPLSLDNVGRPLIPVRIMGQEVMTLVDTGSTLASMTPALANSVGARRGSSKANGQRVETAENVPVQIGQASINLGIAAIGHDKPGQSQLTIGMELFLQAVVQMDFDAGRLTLIHRDAFVAPKGEPVSVQSASIVPTVQLTVNGHNRPICALLDTGFNDGVNLTSEDANELALARDPSRVGVGEGFAGERAQLVALAPLAEVRIGDQTFRNVPAAEVIGRGLGIENKCSGLLGMAALGRHNLTFDLKKGKVWFLPRGEGQ